MGGGDWPSLPDLASETPIGPHDVRAARGGRERRKHPTLWRCRVTLDALDAEAWVEAAALESTDELPHHSRHPTPLIGVRE